MYTKTSIKTSTPIKRPNITVEEIISKVQCDNCFKYYASAKSLANHLGLGRCIGLQNKERHHSIAEEVAKGVAKVANILLEKQAEQQAEQQAQQAKYFKEMTTEFTNLLKSHDIKVPAIHNHQHLNVMCLGSKDNLLDILTQQTDLPTALVVIKDAALGKLAADCRILKRVYCPDNKRPAIMSKDKSKNQFIYYNEKNEKKVETSMTEMGKKLADILQRTYSKALGELKTDICGNVRNRSHSQSSLPDLEPYDIQFWHHHLQELQDEKYQKQLIKTLNLLTEKEVLAEYSGTN
jgi:hypothetical protein